MPSWEGLAAARWQRLPGFRTTTARQWADPAWQIRNSARSVQDLRSILGDLVPDSFYEDLARDQAGSAPMPLGLSPHWLSLIRWERALECPLRRYTLPLHGERRNPPSHPMARPDPLRESVSSPAPGLIRRYPSTVLVLLSHNCPVLCGYCSRMRNRRTGAAPFQPHSRDEALLRSLHAMEPVEDILVSGGDLSMVPMDRLEPFLGSLLDIRSLREIRLATRAPVALPQWVMQPRLLLMLEKLTGEAASRGIRISLQTQVNHPQAITSATVNAVAALKQAGLAEVRNQAVLLAGVNDQPDTMLRLHRKLWLEADILPYYVFLCELLPGVEHWRVPLARAVDIQEELQGMLPGFLTPRFRVDLVGLGKRSLDSRKGHDPILGLHWWRGLPPMLPHGTTHHDATAITAVYPDPLHTLSEEGRQRWQKPWREILSQLPEALQEVPQ